MNQVLHLFKKDVYRYRWALLALALMSVCEVYLYGTSVGLMDTGWNRLLAVITSVIGALLFFFLIVLVVQEETLADPQAYWLGRPLSRGAILTEKLLFLALLIGLFTVTKAIVTLLNGGGHLTVYVLLGVLPGLAIWQLQVFLAAQTASLPRYLVLTVCLVIGFYGLLFLVLFVLQPSRIFSWNFGLLPAHTPPHWVSLIRHLYWLIVGLGILTYLYQRRRILRTWVAVGVAGVVSLLITPSESFFGSFIGSAFSEKQDALAVDSIMLSGTVHRQGQEFVECNIVFKPHDQLVDGDIWIRIQSLTLRADGVSIEVKTANVNQRLQSVGGTAIAMAGLIERSQLDELTSDQINLSGFAYVFFSHQHRIGAIPLREGAAFRGAGNRLLVDSIYRRDDQLRLTLTGVVPDLHFVPNQLTADQEPFDGRFAFALLDAEAEQFVADFGVRRSFDFSPGRRQPARIEVDLSQNAPLDDYLIAIYERQISHQTWHPLIDHNVKLIQ